MSEVEAAYIAIALAEGKHMTEGSIAEMTTARTYSQEAIEKVHRWVESESFSTIAVALELLETRGRIETLEQAVLKSWKHYDTLDNVVCGVCDDWTKPHTTDCIVPALQAKYEEN